MDPSNDLFIGFDNVTAYLLLCRCVCGRATDVIYAFEDGDVFDSRLREHVSLHAREGVRSQAVLQDPVAAGGLVGDGDLLQ